MIYLATDHRGFELKEKIKAWLSEWGYDFYDFGAFEYDQEDDYPDFIHKAAQKVSESPEQNKAIILGGSGQGEAMVANRYKGVRAAVLYGPSLKLEGFRTWLLALGGGGGVADKVYNEKLAELVKLSREHNNANVLSLGTSFLSERAAKYFIKLWLDTPFSGDERHVRRIRKIDL